MNAIDTMINRATFELVVIKRQKYVAAVRAANAADDACTCARRCLPDCPARSARVSMEQAAADLDGALSSWRAWHAG